MSVMRCMRSFSASSRRHLIQPPLSSKRLRDLKCSNIPPTMPGTAATVSSIMAWHPYFSCNCGSSRRWIVIRRDQWDRRLKYCAELSDDQRYSRRISDRDLNSRASTILIQKRLQQCITHSEEGFWEETEDTHCPVRQFIDDGSGLVVLLHFYCDVRRVCV